VLIDASLSALGLVSGDSYLYWFDGEFDEGEMLQEAYRENRALRSRTKSRVGGWILDRLARTIKPRS
jgi:hypothetical protein